MISPFFFAIGKKVYQSRKEILNILEHRPDGEKLWNELIRCLNLAEKGGGGKRESLPNYKQYPQTIMDAKQFFILDEEINN